MLRTLAPTKPNFICIGPDRTGTTWLYQALRAHPSVWLPPVKEIKALAEGNLFPAYSYRKLFFSKQQYYRAMRSSPHRILAKALLGRESFENFRWALRYAFRFVQYDFSFEWYSSLFDNRQGLLSGDISPKYYYLPAERIQASGKAFPHCKVIIFVRNPIARVWSTVGYFLKRQGYADLDAVPKGTFLFLIDDVYSKWRAYDDTITLWKKYFPQVFAGRFDDLDADPKGLFKEICAFLEISTDVQMPSLERKVNQGAGKQIPPEFADRLREQYTDEIYRLAELGYCRDPQAWLDYGRE